MKTLLSILILLAFASICYAETFVITNADQPTTVINEKGAGNEFIVEDGLYDAIYLKTIFKGSEASPTIIRARNPGKVRIRPKTPYLCGVYSEDNCPPEWLTVEGFEVSGCKVDGIRFVGGVHVTVKNCASHNNTNMGIALHKNKNSVIEFCQVYNNGVDGSNQKHGIYLSGENLIIRNCLVYYNSGYGIHLWEWAWASSVVDNICYGNKEGAGIVVQTINTNDTVSPERGNMIARNTVFDNKMGIQLSRSAYDRVVDNKIWGNEFSINVYYPSLAPVFFSGNTVDKPATGTNNLHIFATVTQPSP